VVVVVAVVAVVVFGSVVVVVGAVVVATVVVGVLLTIVTVVEGDDALILPASSRAIACTVCAPSGSVVVATSQRPVESADAPPRVAVPSSTCTDVPGSAVPSKRKLVNVVTLSPCTPESVDGSSTGADGALGAIVSTLNEYGVTASDGFGRSSVPVS